LRDPEERPWLQVVAEDAAFGASRRLSLREAGQRDPAVGDTGRVRRPKRPRRRLRAGQAAQTTLTRANAGLLAALIPIGRPRRVEASRVRGRDLAPHVPRSPRQSRLGYAPANGAVKQASFDTRSRVECDKGRTSHASASSAARATGS